MPGLNVSYKKLKSVIRIFELTKFVTGTRYAGVKNEE